MRLAVASAVPGYVVALAGDLASAAANPAWAGLPLVSVDEGMAEGFPVPADAEIVARPVADAGPAPVVVSVAKIDFFRRCSEEEADQIEVTVAQQDAKMRNIFNCAASFRSDAPEWAMLVGLADALFGPSRAAELLAPSA